MKFRLKITLSMLCLLSLLFGAGGSMLIDLSFQNSLEREREAAYHAYQMVLGTLQIVSGGSGRFDYEDLSATLEQLSNQNAGGWTGLRLASESRQVYGYRAAQLTLPQEHPAPGTCTIRYLPDAGAGHTLALSGSLEAGGETLYLDLARDISPLFAAREAQQRTYQGVFLLMAGLCALLAYTMARVLTAPLVDLSRASRAIAEGRLSSRARISSRDEVGMLAQDFNAMAAALEENIAQLTEAAARQERFIGSFAHEVKTPMTSILGYADLIRGQTLSGEEAAQAADYIFSEGKRLESLSQKLLDLLVLKGEETVLAPGRPAALIRGLAARLEPLYRKQGIALTCDCEEGTCLLEPELIRSLLLNLWDNARKAMDGRGGVLSVRGTCLPDGYRITVADSGRGMPPQALEHLTEAFYRVDKARSRAQGGVGLGLALCGEIVALHHGTLRFESREGAGTTVTVELRGGAA